MPPLFYVRSERLEWTPTTEEWQQRKNGRTLTVLFLGFFIECIFLLLESKHTLDITEYFKSFSAGPITNNSRTLWNWSFKVMIEPKKLNWIFWRENLKYWKWNWWGHHRLYGKSYGSCKHKKSGGYFFDAMVLYSWVFLYLSLTFILRFILFEWI